MARLIQATALFLVMILLATVSGSTATAHADAAGDRAALVALYNATGGANWTENAKWLSNEPLSQWHGVTTDANGRVTKLDLYENDLAGEMPAELGNLANLKLLSLYDNQLSGGIPSALGNLTNLESLSLFNNQLNRPIPPALGNLTNLESLDLGDNQLSGEIPSALGDLSNLEGMEIFGNQLSGEIPSALGGLAKLERLWLHENQLSGEIPAELGNLVTLRKLGISDNQLTGSIPAWLGDLANLGTLYLSGNQLTGCIPVGLWGVADNDLDQLGLLFCGPDPDAPYLTWEVGDEIPDAQRQSIREGILFMHRYAESVGLPELQGRTTIYLYDDPDTLAGAYARAFGTSVDEARRRLASVTWLGEAGIGANDEGYIFIFLARNPRDASSPARLMQVAAHELSHIYQYTLGEFGKFDASHDQVYVHGPAWLSEGVSDFHSLRALAKGGVISYEQRRGDVAGIASGVDSPLNELETYAELTAGPGRYDYGAMAAELLAAEAGEEALITYWTLLGPERPWQEAFETAFGMTVDGFYVLFEDHRAAGFPALGLPSLEPEIPVSPVDRAALAALYNATGGANWANNANWLSDAPGNEWYGVTTNLNGRVTELDLGSNQLSGEIPAQLGSLSDLEILNLWENMLSGELPAALGNLGELTHLRLWSNQLTGEIPPELANLANLEQFAVGGNRLIGNIPEELGNLSNLRELHLPTNQLTGEIPAELGNLSNLKHLNLNNNQFTGTIPAELGNLTDLETLYLNRNRLTGCLPAVWRDVSNNDFDHVGLGFYAAQSPPAPPTPPTPPAPPAPADPCLEVEYLGALTAPATRMGAWADDCDSEARPGSYARYYSFTLDQAGRVEINLTSKADSYLVLRQGAGRDGMVEVENDNSSINRMLAAGTYTVEATTYFGRQTGDFTLSITAEEILSVNLSRAAGSENAQVRLGSPASLTATFSGPVSGFTDEDITVGNGVAGNFAGGDDDAIYTFEVTPNAIGEVTVDIAAGAAADAGGNGNTAAPQFSLGVPYDDDRDGAISRPEVISAIREYLGDMGDITRSEVIQLIRLYLAG